MDLFKKTYTVVAIVLVMILAISGCVSLPAVWNVNETPGFRQTNFSNEDVNYDASIRGFRWKNKKSDSGDNEVLRDENGKKIISVEDMSLYFEAKNRMKVGTGTKYTTYALSAIYTPIVIIEQVVGTIISSPFFWIMNNTGKKIKQEIESAYISGRQHFDAGEYKAALLDWDYAEPVFQQIPFYYFYYSDINYWRGRAYENLGNSREASNSYHLFLNYSERSTPYYFTVKYPNELSWAQKADVAEKSISRIQMETISAQK